LSLFLVRLLESEFPISHGARLVHGYTSNAAQQGLSAIRVIGSPRKPLLQGAATGGATAGEAAAGSAVGRLSWRVPFMRALTTAHQPQRGVRLAKFGTETAPIMTPSFNLRIGPSGHSVRHGKTRSPKADLTTLLKMRRATQVHHEYARPSDRANSSLVRLSVRQQNLDFREGIGRLSWWPLSCEP
jgi:hypothetical protein